MKKANLILLVVIAGIGFSYLLYKSWVVFGWWTLTWTAIVSIFSRGLLENLTSARSESNGTITFNPKEWPKYLSVLISIAIGYYLYTKINVPGVNSGDYTFGVYYLVTLSLIPCIYVGYKITRNRNDYIKVDSSNLSYCNNEDFGEIKFIDISLAKLEGGIIHITLRNSSVIIIKLKNMNFNAKDQKAAFAEIAKRISIIDDGDLISRVKNLGQ
jgi:hypothetical protein